MKRASLGHSDPLWSGFLFCNAKDQTQGLQHDEHMLSFTPGPSTLPDQTVWTNNSSAAAECMHPPAFPQSTVCAKKRADRISVVEQSFQALGLIFTCLYEQSPGLYEVVFVTLLFAVMKYLARATSPRSGLFEFEEITVHHSGEGMAVGTGDQWVHPI